MNVIPDADRQRLARLLTHLHDHPQRAEEILADEAFGVGSSAAHVVGVSGVAGAGKSTLIARMLSTLRDQDLRIVVLAIDPTSERSQGALLGDRIRMRDAYLDRSVFIRSLATRGAPEALTVGLPAIIRACAAVSDMVIVETAGAGQVDVGIHRMVDTFVVMLVPLGDAVTLMKSGQAEHAHVVAVNAREGLPDTDIFVDQARALLADGAPEDGWERRVYCLDAKRDQGIEEFVHDGVLAHRDSLRGQQG